MVITNVNQVVYQGDGVTTAWPFTFPIIDNTDLRLTLINEAGARTDITSDYYVDMVNNTVYYPGYAPGAEPPEANQPPKVQSGEKLEIYRRVPVNQMADLGEKWPFNVIEKGLDKLTMICQDIYSWIGRNIVGLTEDGTAWDAKGLPINNVGGPAGVDDAATKDYVDRILSGIIASGDGRVVPFDNVAQLIDADIVAGQIACTLGYYDINDGGAGVYNIRAKTPYDADDGGHIIFLDNGNVAELITDGTVYVKQFGAVGDDVADDTNCFKKALAYCKTNKKVLIIPAETYLLSDILDGYGIQIFGDSPRFSVLHFVSGQLSIGGLGCGWKNFKIVNDGNDFAITATYLSQTSYVENVFIEGNNCFEISRSWYATLKNIQINTINTTGIGMSLKGIAQGGVNNLDISGMWVHGGLHSVVIDGTTYACENDCFINCTFEGSYSSAIKTIGAVPMPSFINCYFEGAGKGTTTEPRIIENTALGQSSRVVLIGALVRGSTGSDYMCSGLTHIINTMSASININACHDGLTTIEDAANVNIVESNSPIINANNNLLRIAQPLILNKTGIVTTVSNTVINLAKLQLVNGGFACIEYTIMEDDNGWRQAIQQGTVFINQGHDATQYVVVSEIYNTSINKYYEVTATTLAYNSVTDRYESTIGINIKSPISDGKVFVKLEGYANNYINLISLL